ncbi:Adipocyte plasma membrane-associated protein [Seminavis robusta]|uniref:Adipocyte plasma membrane-associated protein n=1 Tax=Seminavis robusta TaxID=568900 RepID=A0A9N8EUC7_9STRA|nr:Adipocyte plasma membrane-associated protein [Seminavis robusta]|eukprot:Sro1711_g292810.1 Adipocyte plasma membrane-associated protein (423) ;mRNA; f:6436-7986
MANSTGLHGSMRIILLVGVISYFTRKYFVHTLFPHGLPVEMTAEMRVKHAPVDSSNDSLHTKHGKLTKIAERLEEGQEPLLIGPETVIVQPKTNAIFAFCRGAKLVRLDDLQPSPDNPQYQTAKVTLAANLGSGAPLSGKFTPDGKTLYVADPILGLFRIRNFGESNQSNIEIVASQVVDNDKITPILFADDVDIGPKTGKIYFSDATDVAPDRLVRELDWDVMYASKVECIRGKRSGRLLEYNPETEQVTVLARGLWFTNGVAVDEEETFLIVSQTFAMRLSKYHLTGPQQGSLETLLDSHQLTGFTDGADLSWATSGPTAHKAYVAVPTPILPIMKVLQVTPHPVDQFVRGLLLLVPKWLAPPPVDYAGFVELDLKTGEVRTFQDANPTDLDFITGVFVQDDKVYLGSLHSNVVGVYDLS